MRILNAQAVTDHLYIRKIFHFLILIKYEFDPCTSDDGAKNDVSVFAGCT